MSGLGRLLAALHARGFHAAVLAGLVMMPLVVAVGFWTDSDERADADWAASLPLRGSLDDRPPAAKPAF